MNPDKEVDDPEDFKPDDWVDVARIADPAAAKPDDWDEDAPKQIDDAAAEKPAGWLDDEPDQVADPEVGLKPTGRPTIAQSDRWTHRVYMSMFPSPRCSMRVNNATCVYLSSGTDAQI